MALSSVEDTEEMVNVARSSAESASGHRRQMCGVSRTRVQEFAIGIRNAPDDSPDKGGEARLGQQ